MSFRVYSEKCKSCIFGGIPHPIFGIMIGLGFEGLSIQDMMQIAERMGWVTLEPLPDEAKE